MKDLTPQAITVLKERYLLENESPEDMFFRVAWAVAQAEDCGIDCHDGIHYLACPKMEWSMKFRQLMEDLDFLPNSPTLANAGARSGQLSACFALPIEDSLEGIFETIKNAALIHKTGGGTGFSFGRLRAAGSKVEGTGHEASGPVSFLKVFNAATNSIKQGGMRRGANMAILPINHPDIRKFIHCKDSGSEITNFNISVAVPDEWVDVVLTHQKEPRSCGQTNNRPDAMSCYYCDLLWEIAESAWKTGDPGLFFIDKANNSRANPVPRLGPIESTNPCGEQPLYSWDICTLGSINLGNFVVEPGGVVYTTVEQISNMDMRVDWYRLKSVVHTAIRFLDNVVSVNKYTLPQIEDMATNIRRIGLGVMGWADMLVKLNVAYDSDEAVALGRDVMEFIHDEADSASLNLAKERGVFPLSGSSIYFSIEQDPDRRDFRNSTRTTIAPTGTISIIANCSSGIEPIFSLYTEHAGLEGKLKTTPFTYQPFIDYLNAYKKPLPATQPGEYWAQAKQFGTAQTITGVPGMSMFKTAHEIPWKRHIDMQAAFQRFTDNAVSKTVNMPHDATVDDVFDAYLYAYEKGCTGITVYRDGSKDGQVLFHAEPLTWDEGFGDMPEPSTSRWFEMDAPLPDKIPTGRQDQLSQGKIIHQNSPQGTVHVSIEEKENDPFAVFILVGKGGSDVAASTEAIGRLISKILDPLTITLSTRERLGVVVEQLSGIGGNMSHGFGVELVRSIPDAIGKALDKYLHPPTYTLNDGGLDEVRKKIMDMSNEKFSGTLCPDCGSGAIEREGGCEVCKGCGWSRC